MLTQKQCEYAAWIATPKKLRVPRTQEELATKLNVSDRTLTRWQTTALWEEVDRIIGENIHTALSEIIAAQIDIATDTDNPRAVNAAKLLIEHMDRTRPKTTEEKLDNQKIIEAAKEELEQWMSERQ
jgi:hypothetical protein